MVESCLHIFGVSPNQLRKVGTPKDSVFSGDLDPKTLGDPTLPDSDPYAPTAGRPQVGHVAHFILHAA